MTPKELVKEIQKLPLRKRFYVLERSLLLIRKQEEENLMTKAADELYEDYSQEKELTAFTTLDFDNFYETK